MTEASKTISLVVVALAVLAAGFFTRPSPPKPPAVDRVGKQLFKGKLDDPLKIKRLRIVTYDDVTGKAKEFEVAQRDGVWSLPPHNYPADAKEQMAAAVAALLNVDVLGVASEDAKDHALYGVVEPDPTKEQAGASGLGKLIVMEDGANKPLARLIIGKEDRPKGGDDFSGAQAKFRYVRMPGDNVVYRAKLAADKFNTKFENWVEIDLLKLSPWDIANVDLRDYTASLGISSQGLAVHLDRRADIDLKFNDKDSKWALEKLLKYTKGKPTEVKLTDQEELNSVKLNEMKTALDDLKIADVARKPAQLSADLKSQLDFTQDAEGARSLAMMGFFAVPVNNNEVEILSDNGEVIVGMKDGVEYVLRFGKIAGIDSGAGDKDEKVGDADEKGDKSASEKGDAKKDEAPADPLKITEKSGASVNRYVMVMARFNANLLPKPELEPLPEIKKAPEKKDEKKADDKKGDDKKGDAKSADGDDKKGEAANTEADQEAQEALREKVEKENKRKQDEYDDKVKKGEEHARDLNARFADWYYVISDATYRKIHLGVDDVVMKKPTADKDAKADPVTPKDPFTTPKAAPKGTSKAAPAPAKK
jgi:hypothetical protein